MEGSEQRGAAAGPAVPHAIEASQQKSEDVCEALWLLLPFHPPDLPPESLISHSHHKPEAGNSGHTVQPSQVDTLQSHHGQCGFLPQILV